MSDNNSKPPIGVTPGDFVAWQRIGDLAEAIFRQYQSKAGDPKLVEKWANEIEWQCTIIESMKEETGSDPQQKLFSPWEVDAALVKHGQNDKQFAYGEKIKYSPSEVRKILTGEM